MAAFKTLKWAHGTKYVFQSYRALQKFWEHNYPYFVQIKKNTKVIGRTLYVFDKPQGV